MPPHCSLLQLKDLLSRLEPTVFVNKMGQVFGELMGQEEEERRPVAVIGRAVIHPQLQGATSSVEGESTC